MANFLVGGFLTKGYKFCEVYFFFKAEKLITFAVIKPQSTKTKAGTCIRPMAESYQN